MSTRLKINLNDFSKTRRFVQEVTKFSSDIDAIKDRYIVDAKSVVGIFTLDLSKPIEIVIHSDDEKEIKKFNEVMNEFK